ncbi:Glycine zipper 2TM domain protein [Rubripirellula tenax]|uniref:Glycine zipper 2TM domain protein n=1 Tax=Rubripirellula tenax TaxID=2528015 RepID=A0A5C6FJ51_9BACT|nr:glycine zipper domain-containing protein [Rubripirellula tenax]TWU60079.1 Glycine zipper 2TM domain protein [Rubripirellula tenax]
MIKRFTLAALLVSVSVAQANAQDHTNRRRGAILGGLAGAAIGVAIGDKGNNETAGALIGGAVGAVAGGTIGDARDQRIDHDRRYHSGYPTYPSQIPAYGPPTHAQPGYPAYRDGQHRQDYYAPRVYDAPPVVYGEPTMAALPAQPTLSTEDVVAMVRSGLSEPMIVRQIQLRGVSRHLAVSEIIALHQQGVSELIIDAMQGVFAEPTVSSPSDFDRNGTYRSNATPTVEGRSYRYPTESPDLYGPSLLAPRN